MGPRQEPLSPALAAALAEVEAAVAHLPRPRDLAGWLDVAEAAKTRILSRAREELTPHDLFDYVDDGPSALPRNEALWFLPALCRHLGAGRQCAGGLGWVHTLALLRRSGFPDDWPEAPVVAMAGYVTALTADALAAPARWSPAFEDELTDPLPLFLAMAAGGGLPLDPVFRGVAALSERNRARALARWSIRAAVVERGAYGGSGFEVMAEILAADAFLPPNDMADIKNWLVVQEPWVMIARAAEAEDEPEWQDVLDEAAGLWAEAARDGAEGRAVSPWRSRSRYLRVYRARRRRRRQRSGQAPTTG